MAARATPYTKVELVSRCRLPCQPIGLHAAVHHSAMEVTLQLETTMPLVPWQGLLLVLRRSRPLLTWQDLLPVLGWKKELANEE